MFKLIFGCGYLGSRVAAQWLAAGEQVASVTRSEERVGELQRQGLWPIVADVTRPETLGQLPAAETVLFAVGFDRQSGKSRQEVYVDGLHAVLDALPAETGRVIFISSTGVYGQLGGGWVDEESPCRPVREAGRAMLAAEQVLAAHPLGRRGVVLRLAGLYGPGRLLRAADLLAGRPLSVPAGNWLNLIHVDDAAAAVLAAESFSPLPQGEENVSGTRRVPWPTPRAQAGEGPPQSSPLPLGEGQGVRALEPSRLFIISDGHPVDRRECYRYLAELLGAPPPQFIAPSPGILASHHSGDNKRTSNARMLAELGVRLVYPTYREGLAAIVAGYNPVPGT